jgi:hypothetical protein
MPAKKKSPPSIPLTDEQKKMILEATGVSVKELSIITLESEEARKINTDMLRVVRMVPCW